MAGEPEDLVLEHLHRLDRRMDNLEHDTRDLKARAGLVETRIAAVTTDIVRIDGRLDRLESCMERIERRLDLKEAH